jgi:hypothetical protein
MANSDNAGFSSLIDDTTELGKALKDIETALTRLDALSLGATKTLGGLADVGITLTVAAYNYAKSLFSSGGVNPATEAAIKRTQELNSEIANLAGAFEDASEGYFLFSESNSLAQSVAELNELVDLGERFSKDQGWGPFGGLDEYNLAIARANELGTKYGITFEHLDVDMGSANATLGEYTQTQELYNELLAKGGPGAELARTRLTELIGDVQNGTLALGGDRGFIWQLQWMIDNYNQYNQQALKDAALRQYAEAALSAAQEVGLLNDNVELFVAAGLQTPAALTAFALTQSALESTFNVIVGGTDKLGQSSQAVADWSASMLDGAIGTSQYSNALAANTQIQEANAAIQGDLLAIQANQAPLLADLTDKQAAYIDELANLPAEQQLVALGYMDAAESAKAMELAQLAAQAASGALGDQGTITAAKIIDAAANADPVLRAMLEDMGLISEGVNGEVVVNFSNAPQLTDNVNALKSSIDALTITLGGIPPSVWTTIYVNDFATYAIDAVGNRLYNLNNSSATVFIKTEYGYLPPVILGDRNGGIIGYANGGMVLAQLAEAGPELLTFRNGGQALVPFPGIYAVDIGTAVLPAPATKSILSNAAAASGGAGMVVNNPIINLYPSSIGIEEQITAELYRWTHQR